MIFAFLVSFFSFAHFRLGGDVYISELLLATYLLLSIRKIRLLSEPFPKKILVLGLLWLLSQIASDLIRGTPSVDYLRGWAAIVFFLIDFCAVYIMASRKKNVARILVIGWALGTIFGTLIFPSGYALSLPWKFGYGIAVMTLILLYFSNGIRFKFDLVILFLMALGLINFYLNYRSLGGVALLTALVLYASRQPVFHTLLLRRVKVMKTGLLAIIAMSGVLMLLTTYQWAAESGYLGDDVTHKYVMNRSSTLGIFGLVLGGRIEWIASIPAVMDSPIIGHGSWAADRKYSLLLFDTNTILGTDQELGGMLSQYEQTDLIPAHSHILQAWVWAGIVGAFFWLAVLVFILKSLLSVVRYPNAMQPITVFFCIAAIWDLLFSPFGSVMRFIWAIKLVFIWLAKAAAESAARTGVAKL